MINFLNKGGINTTDATATADDIIAPKTAYVNGEKIEGAIKTTKASVGISSLLEDSFSVKETYNLFDSCCIDDYLILVAKSGSNMVFRMFKDHDLVAERSYPITGNFTHTTIQSMVVGYNLADDDKYKFTLYTAYQSGTTWYSEFKEILFNIDNSTIEIGKTVTHQFGSNASGAGMRVAKDTQISGRFYLYYKNNSDGCVYQISVNWDTETASGVYKQYTGYYYDTTLFTNSGDNWITGKNRLYYINKAAQTVTVYNIDAPVWFSPNMKYMCYNNKLYSITNSDNWNTINSNKKEIMALPTYTNVWFDKEEQYLCVNNATTLFVYRITDEGVKLDTQYSFMSCTLVVPFKSDMLFIYDNISNEISVFYYRTDEITNKLVYDNIPFLYTGDATAEDDDIFYNKTAYINGQKVIGSMPVTYKDIDATLFEHHNITAMVNSTFYRVDTLKVDDYLFVAIQENSNIHMIAVKNKKVVGDTVLPYASLHLDTTNIGGIAINLSNKSDKFIDIALAIGYNNGNGSSPTVYNRVRYDMNTKAFALNATHIRLDALVNNTGNNYGYAITGIKGMPNVFVMYYSRWESVQNVQIIKVSWTEDGVGSRSYYNFQGTFSYSYARCETTGDGTWFNHNKGLGKMFPDATNFYAVTTDGQCFISHNLKYMVMNNVLYKVDPTSTTSSALYNSKVLIQAGLPAYTGISFSEDDTYLMVYRSNNTVEVYTFGDDGYELVQTISINGARHMPFGSTAVFSCVQGSNLIFWQYDTDSVLASIQKDGKIFVNTEDADATASDIAAGKTAYVNGIMLTGSMPEPPSITKQEYEEAVTYMNALLGEPVTFSIFNNGDTAEGYNIEYKTFAGIAATNSIDTSINVSGAGNSNTGSVTGVVITPAINFAGVKKVKLKGTATCSADNSFVKLVAFNTAAGGINEGSTVSYIELGDIVNGTISNIDADNNIIIDVRNFTGTKYLGFAVRGNHNYGTVSMSISEITLQY